MVYFMSHANFCLFLVLKTSRRDNALQSLKDKGLHCNDYQPLIFCRFEFGSLYKVPLLTFSLLWKTKMSLNFEQESCPDEFIIIKQNQLLMDSRPIIFFLFIRLYGLKSTFFSLWHHRRLICFIKRRRKGENSNL